MEQLSPLLTPDQVLTDVGSTKALIHASATRLFNRSGRAYFVGGHPMAGKEVGGAAAADAGLFRGAAWIFVGPDRDDPLLDGGISPIALIVASDWAGWVEKMGCRRVTLDPSRHDELLAWVSHLPQFLSTALTALLETEVGEAAELNAIGGRALREMTRLGSSPYSMWRDIALTNTDAIADALQALEQRLAHLRENLRTPELRIEFDQANRFRKI